MSKTDGPSGTAQAPKAVERGRDERPSLALAVRLRAAQLQLIRIWGLWLTIVVVMVAFWGANAAFFAGANLLDLVRAASALAIVALGQTLVIVSGELDLSIGSVYAMVPVILGVLWEKEELTVYAAIPVALLCGAMVGVVNGFFSVVTKIPSFVVTLGMLNLAIGVTVLIGESRYFNPEYDEPPLPKGELGFFKAIGGSEPLGIPAQVLWLIGISIVFILILHRSLFGFRLMAIGGNPDAARVARLPVRRYRFIAFVACSFMAGLAGVIEFSFLGQAQSSVSGSGITFPVFAAVIIGGASLAGGSGTVIGTLSGAILLQVLSNGLALIGVGAGWTLVFIGGITIVAVGLDRWAALGPLIGEKVRILVSARRALPP